MNEGIFDNWSVDLATVGAVWPWQGPATTVLVFVGVAFWLWWHIWCMRWEKGYHDRKIAKYGDSSALKDALDAGQAR